MLDQNTDRMWYVIGAVIVGAAIILILNGTMPQIFASVAETFEGKTDVVTEVTDGIMPLQRQNLVIDGQAERIVQNAGTSTYDSNGAPTEKFIHYDLTHVLKPDTSYEMSFDYKSSANIHSIDVFFLGRNPESNRRLLPNTHGEWKQWSHTFNTNSPTVDSLTPWWSGKQIRFDNNYSKTAEPATLWTKNVVVREVVK